MSATTEHPRVFISYSWSGSDHENDVIELATTLRNHGVDAVLDKWDLKPGQDKFVFMESMVTDASVAKVLVLCDRRYQEKANSRAGGVGTESQIISQELYAKVLQTKFIPIVFEYDDGNEPCLPVFLKGRIYVDMSSPDRYGAGLDELLRQIYEQPLHQKPALGSAPSFLKADGGVPQTKELGAALKALQDGRASRHGVEHLFFDAVLGAVNRLYSEPTGDDFHEGVYQAIQQTKGLRDQLSDYFDALAGFSGDESRELVNVGRFLDGLGSKFGPPERDGAYYPGWSDHFAFFALETFLLFTAALLRHERWGLLRKVLRRTYVVRKDHEGPVSTSYVAFDSWLSSIDEHRNHRLKLGRASLSADMLKERCSTDKTSFSELLQADVFLALDAALRCGDSNDSYTAQYWAPRTTVYFSGTRSLPLFLRAADADFRENIRLALGLSSAAEMQRRIELAKSQLDNFNSLSVGRGYRRFGFVTATNLAVLSQP